MYLFERIQPHPHFWPRMSGRCGWDKSLLLAAVVIAEPINSKSVVSCHDRSAARNRLLLLLCFLSWVFWCWVLLLLSFLSFVVVIFLHWCVVLIFLHGYVALLLFLSFIFSRSLDSLRRVFGKIVTGIGLIFHGLG